MVLKYMTYLEERIKLKEEELYRLENQGANPVYCEEVSLSLKIYKVELKILTDYLYETIGN